MATIAGTIFLGLAAFVLVGGPAADKPAEGPPPGLGLTPSFAEEFDSPTLDDGKWIYALYDPASEKPTAAKRNLWSNRELQIYSDAGFPGFGVNPFGVTGGVLTITANPLAPPAHGAVMAAIDRAPPSIRAGALRDVTYSSGLISSRKSFSQTYGYFEMRARWSAGKGLWPAFWLLPAAGKWPPEIDILEAHGDKPDTAFQSIHSTVTESITRRVTMAGDGPQYHNYGALWTPTTIDYFIDGRKTASVPTPSDMTGPMYLIANLAVGGKWPGNPDGDTKFPATMQIDYIRAWKLPPQP